MSCFDFIAIGPWKFAFDRSRTRRLAKCSVTLLLFAGPLLAQVTIRNPERLEVSEQEVQLLFHTTCQVVADEFHFRRGEGEFPLILVLGDPVERYTSDEEHQLYTVYLHRWNEAQFAASAMRLALQHMVTQSRRDHMVWEILKRSATNGPISVHALRSAK